MGWLETILRFISFWLDKLFYGFVPTIYNLLVDIANTTIFTEDIFDTFASKVYGLLGIFMLFKVSFSILTYIVDPDAFLDKSKGFSKLISNVIITLTLLIATPWLFSQAMEIQQIILRDNILGKIFSTTSVNPNVTANAGNVMAYETFKAFYHFNYDDYSDCKATGKTQEFNGSGDCQAALGLEDDNQFDNLKNTLNGSFNYPNIDEYMNYALLHLKDSNDEYVMYYIPIISTLAGVALLLLLIVFCFDVALRSVKLGFLRMIAPVPIISRIDPKKGKETFDKWVKTTIGTYLDLFIRLLAIYFAIFVITQVIDLKFVDATTGLPAEVNVFVKVFIILGALLFAKQLPQLIQDLTGIKMDGKFTLNPLKKMSTVPIAGKAASLAVGGADSWVHGNGFMAGVKRNWNNVPLTGGDGKTSILDTADRKMRKEIKEKRDTARQRYEGLERQRKLEEQLELGRAYSGKTPEELYSGEYLESYNSVNEAKNKMYAWENYITKVERDYQTAADQFGANSDEAIHAYKAIEEARKNYGSAKGQYEYRKTLHDSIKNQYEDFAEIENAIEAYEKTGGKSIGEPPKIEINQNISFSPTTNTATSSGQVQTQNGDTINVQKGEQYTSSGIIIGNDSNWNKK